MTDPTTLARAARRALAQAHTATLLIDGLGRVSPDPAHVLLDDHDGRPRFTCSTGSPIATAAAARRPAILDVGRPLADSPHGGSVIFAGHLAVAAPAVGAPACVQVVEMQLVSVVVEVDDADSPTVVARRVPLEIYCAGGARTDLAQAAETMRVHTNVRHAERLRGCAAARAGVGDSEIIEAQLVEVALDGATLEWWDIDGGHAVRMRFPRPAVDAKQLAAALRTQLCAHRRHR